MKLFIGYASKEGQSRKIARHIADLAYDAGHSIEISAVSQARDLDFERFDTAVLIAPIHAGHYPKPLSQFVSNNADQLNRIKARFVSVSLAAAGYDDADWRHLEQIIDDLSKATSWSPYETKHVAGAYKPSEYDVLTRFIMRRIVTEKDPGVPPAEDKEYTDWADLEAWVRDWLNS